MLRLSVLITFALSIHTLAASLGGPLKTAILDESKSPYIIELDIVIPQGEKLTINPGVVLMFKAFTGIIVEGELIVEGTSQKPVVFTSVNDNRFGPPTGQLPNPFDWNGVQLAPKCTGARLRNLHVLYGVYGINAQTANMFIDNCVFSQNGQFNVKAGDTFLYPKENTPFTFGAAAGVSAEATTLKAAAPKKDLLAQSEPRPRAANVFRYTCLGGSLAGAALGTVFAVQAARAADSRDASVSSSDWDTAEQTRQSRVIGLAVSYGAAAMLLAGFALTFAF